jgi:tetratricopeptide (TPR) repeat protein
LRYQWFVALAFVLLLLDALTADGARWPAWRRRRAAVTVALLLVGAAPLRAQVPSFGDALERQRAGKTIEAIRAYRALVADGDRRGVVLYNLGTALLAADSLDAAIEALERATFIGDAELRRKARYNLGLAYLERGRRQDGEQRSTAMQAARKAFRTVLLETPGDADAQWNYELALRQPSGGGGGGGGQQQQPEAPSAEPTPQRPMTRQQAEALLDAAQREERDTQARRRRGDRPARSAGPDW